MNLRSLDRWGPVAELRVLDCSGTNALSECGAKRHCGRRPSLVSAGAG
jgi:hypothetical protein